MGEIVGLCIGSYEFLSRKNTFGDLLSIFSLQLLSFSFYLILSGLKQNANRYRIYVHEEGPRLSTSRTYCSKDRERSRSDFSA